MLGVVGIVAVNRTSPSALEISDSVATIDPVGALFVLPEPLDAYDLANPYVSEASSAAGGGTAGLGADGVLLGIEDGTGDADLRTATVYDESPTQHGEWTQVDTPTGPAYTTPGPLAAAAQQYGDQWLVITTFGDANLALDVLDDIRIDDTGEIVVDTEPSDLVVISELTQPSGSGLHVTSYELTTAGQSRITVETGVHDTPLALGAGLANRLEPTEIDGTRAWVATRVDADGPWIGLVWSATPNRIVAVSGHDVSVTEITQVAESLQYVDEATWRQAFSDVTID